MQVRRFVAVLLLCVLAAGCGGSPPAERSPDPVSLRLGFFPNVTHATALVGVEEGIFEAALAGSATLSTSTFNAGPEAIEALFSGAIDATYIGPNPAINAFARSDGRAIRIIAGATSGGAALVVRADIESPAQLAGTTLASPSLGNTQDVALRAWLAEQGFETDLEGGGEVTIMPQANGQILDAFRTGTIDGAWVPEPWATRMVDEGGGRVLIDERDLWPDGRFVTTHLIVSTTFLEAQPEAVRALLAGHIDATDFINANTAAAQATVGGAIEELTGAELPPTTLQRAWSTLTFTVDPVASSLATSAREAEELGLLDPVDLDGIYALDTLNGLLRERGVEPVADE